MKKPLDPIHHIAIEVTDVAQAIQWYTENFHCELSYQDETWGLLKFANTEIALVLPGKHPRHIAIPTNDLEKYGTPKKHRDGTSSVYLTDPFGNSIEMIKL